MFTTKSNQIFSQAIADYHRFDKVDMPESTIPYKNGSIEYLLYLKNWIDTVQWHLEDIIRDPHIDPEIALKTSAASTVRTRSAPTWWNTSTVIFSICIRTFP